MENVRNAMTDPLNKEQSISIVKVLAAYVSLRENPASLDSFKDDEAVQVMSVDVTNRVLEILNMQLGRYDGILLDTMTNEAKKAAFLGCIGLRDISRNDADVLSSIGITTTQLSDTAHLLANSIN